MLFWCPACDTPHQYRIAGPEEPIWKFNGDLDKPTFTPSLLMQWNAVGDQPLQICHLFVTAGIISYCNDCTHPLRGHTIEIPDLPAPWDTMTSVE